ncbi:MULTISPECIES: ABC transporter substrate-binding protein [unclassified Arthrobacter]|uniref:ABC transporter substrate-binding protein n=1 Tax=unclassified Arthrobacter TaxID=235627 RepID=UPI0036713357
MKKNAEEFMKLHPQAKINVGGITNEDLRQSGGRLFTSSDAPDLVSYTLQSAIMEDWIQAGALQPLDDVWEKDKISSTVSETANKLATASDGKKYSVPLGLTLLPYVFYNKDVWAKAGATPPDPKTHVFKSLDEFNKSLAAVKAAGYTPFSVPGVPFAEYMFSSPFSSSCGSELYQKISNNWKADGDSAPKYTEPCAVKAIQQMVDWNKAGYFPSGLEGMSFEQSQTLFDTQKAGSWIMGSWVPPVYEPKNFKWDWALFPSLGSEPSAAGVSLDSFLVPAGAKNPELAKSFISYMIQKDTLEKGMGRVPAREDVDLTKVMTSKTEISLTEALKTGAQTAAWFSIIPASIEQAFAQHVVSGAMAGSLTAEQAAQKLQDAADKYRETHK